jgi:hypothetical protein
MLSMQLTVVTADGAQTYTVTPKVQVDFERHFKTGIAKAFQEDLRVEQLYWLAWAATRAAGTVVKPFDAWLEEIIDVQLEDVPTRPFDATA